MKAHLRHLRSHSMLRSVKKGSSILFQGETPEYAMIVQSGIVRAYSITASGEERVTELYSKGAIFPVTWLLGQADKSLFYFDAITDCELLMIKKDVFLDLLAKDESLFKDLLYALGRQYGAVMLRITGLGQTHAVEKIGFTLYYLLIKYGQEQKPGVYVVNMKLTQLMIANLVGLTRESTTKNLKTLKDKGIVTYRRSRYTINRPKLEAFLGEDGFRDLDI